MPVAHRAAVALPNRQRTRRWQQLIGELHDLPGLTELAFRALINDEPARVGSTTTAVYDACCRYVEHYEALHPEMRAVREARRTAPDTRP